MQYASGKLHHLFLIIALLISDYYTFYKLKIKQIDTLKTPNATILHIDLVNNTKISHGFTMIL